MAKKYTTKTATLRATQADIDLLNVKKLKILQGADLDGIVLPTDYYQFIGRTSLTADEKYTLLNDDAKEIYYTYKQTVVKLTDGTKLYMNNKELETWSDSLQYLTIGDNMFTNSSLVTFDSALPSLRNGDYMFLNSSLENFATSNLPIIESSIGMFKGCKLTEPLSVTCPNLITTTQMFADGGTEDVGVNVTLSFTTIDTCENMFNNCHIDNATINSSSGIKGNKMFYKAKAAKETSKIDLSNAIIYNADNMFVGWNGVFVLPSSLQELSSANYTFSEIKPFNGGAVGTPISNNKFTVKFSSSLVSANGTFNKAIIDNPQISFSSCSKLSNKNDIFKDCYFRTASSIDFTNRANTTAPNYVILPNVSSSMNYANYFSNINAEEAALVNVIIDTEDGCTLNLSNFCENSKFNQFIFHPFNDDLLGDEIQKVELTSAFKNVTAQNFSLDIVDIIAHDSTVVSANSMMENAVIGDIAFNANKLTDASKLFKNAQIGAITELNIADIVVGDEAFMNSSITTIGENEGEGVGLESLTSANSMFEGCTNVSITYPMSMPILQKANRMFYGCSASSLEINESALREAESMFESSTITYAFVGTDTQIDENTTIKTVTNLTSPKSLRNTFKNCVYLTHPMKGYETDDAIIPTRAANISQTQSVLNLSNVTSTESMFEGCTSLKFIDAYAPILTTMRNMFKGCTNLGRATLGTTALVDGTNAFQDCTSLSVIDLDEMKITGSSATLINGDGMFKNDANLKYKIDENNYAFTNLELAMEMFKNANLNYTSQVAVIQEGQGEGEVTEPQEPEVTEPQDSYIMATSTLSFPKLVLGREMFENANLTTIDIDLPNLQDGSGMFKNSSLSNFSAEHENQLKNLVGAANMFSGCPLSEDAVLNILTAIKQNNTGLTATKLTNNSYEPIISNPAKAVITNYDVNTYNEANTIGIMHISCISDDIATLVTSCLGVCVDNIVSSSQTDAHVQITNTNEATWNVYLTKLTN